MQEQEQVNLSQEKQPLTKKKTFDKKKMQDDLVNESYGDESVEYPEHLPETFGFGHFEKN